MLVLWDPSFMDRLWCMFEVGAFLHSPVVVAIVAEMVVINAVATLAWGWIGAPREFYLVVTAMCSVPMVLLIHVSRGYCRTVEKLQDDMAHFSIENLTSYCCTVDHKDPSTGDGMHCDRKIILQCIRTWFGTVQTFEQRVQSEVLQLLVDQLSNEVFSYAQAVAITTPVCWGYLDFGFDWILRGNSSTAVHNFMRGLTYMFAVSPTLLLLLFRLAYWVRRQRSLLLDPLVSLLVFLAGAVFFLVGLGHSGLNRDPLKGFCRLMESGRENLEWSLMEHESAAAFLEWLGQCREPGSFFGSLWGQEEDDATDSELRRSVAATGGAIWPRLWAPEPFEWLRRWAIPVASESASCCRSDVTSPQVQKLITEDGRSYRPKTFQKAVAILRREQMISTDMLNEFSTFVQELNDLAESQEAALANVSVPDEFLDPIMSEIMVDPVLLPTSSTIMDRKAGIFFPQLPDTVLLPILAGVMPRRYCSFAYTILHLQLWAGRYPCLRHLLDAWCNEAIHCRAVRNEALPQYLAGPSHKRGWARMRELRGWSMANMDLVPSRCAVARSNLWDDEEKPYDKTFAFPVENPPALREPIPFKPAHGQQGLAKYRPKEQIQLPEFNPKQEWTILTVSKDIVGPALRSGTRVRGTPRRILAFASKAVAQLVTTPGQLKMCPAYKAGTQGKVMSANRALAVDEADVLYLAVRPLHLDTDVIDTALETYAVNFSIGEGLAGIVPLDYDAGFSLPTGQVRQTNLTSGLTTDFAGRRNEGFLVASPGAGDGGAAVFSVLAGPVAMVAAGEVSYIAESDTGVIRTLPQSVPSAGQSLSLYGLTLDSSRQILYASSPSEYVIYRYHLEIGPCAAPQNVANAASPSCSEGEDCKPGPLHSGLCSRLCPYFFDSALRRRCAYATSFQLPTSTVSCAMGRGTCRAAALRRGPSGRLRVKARLGDCFVVLEGMVCVRHLSGRELLTATEEEAAAVARVHGSVPRGIEQLLSPIVGQPCFRLKLLCGDIAVDPDTTLKLPLELKVIVCDFVEFDADDVDRLSHASQENDTAAVEALLRRPQNPDLVDSHGRTALIAAAGSGALKSVKLLSSAWADLNKTCKQSGASAIYTAAQNGHLDVVSFLLEEDADKDTVTNVGATPVIVAAHGGHLEVVCMLIEKHADKHASSNDGSIAVFVASEKGYIDVVHVLIEMGADKDAARNDDGATPVFIASQNGHFHVVDFLIEKGANKDSAMSDGATPVMIAADRGHLEVVRLLIEMGADKNAAQKDGVTPVFIASQNGHLDVVRLLVEKDADKDKAMNDGATPIFVASQEGHLDVVRFLIEKGATTTTVTGSGAVVVQENASSSGSSASEVDRGTSTEVDVVEFQPEGLFSPSVVYDPATAPRSEADL
eukprot:s904_g1.t1